MKSRPDSGSTMTVRQAILKQLTDSRNAAVERAVGVALAAAGPQEQRELAEVLLTRNQRSGWVAMIRSFDRLAGEIQEKLISRPRDLFGPLAETMQDPNGTARENVIAIVGRCADPKLVYLLAEALMDSRVEVRELAGNSLLAAIRRYCSADAAAGGTFEVENLVQLRRAVDTALRQFRTHRQPTVLLAALIFERQQDGPIWSLFQDTYDELTRAATVILRAPPEPALARSILLALGSSLKPAAMAGLAAIENTTLAAAVARESYRLLDPVLREGSRAVNHLKLLPAVRKDPPWKLDNWSGWLRLVEQVGLQPAERLLWLHRMLESSPAGESGAAWRVSILRAIAETGLPEAGRILALCTSDPDERVARCAARHLLGRKIAEWRELHESLRQSPHLSVRRLVLAEPYRNPREAAPMNTVAAAKKPASGFDRAWNDYQKLPPVMQHSAAKSTVGDPASAEQLRAKLNGTQAADITQGLKMLSTVPDLTAYRAQIITLCGHADARIAAMAVHLVGQLADPRLKDLLEAAMHHGDARVRANAVESMEELHIADCSQLMLGMLNSRHNRERANAIKAISKFDFATARECLTKMLTDPNPAHRISALWVVSQLDLLEVVRQVSVVARRDPNLRVRKRAAEMLISVSGNSVVQA